MTKTRTVITLALTLIAALCFAGQDKVLGRVAEALRMENVLAGPSSDARVFYTVKQNERLVVQSAVEEGWLRVYMTNGAYAYIAEDAVTILPYNYVAKPSRSTPRKPRVGGSSSSRGVIADYALTFRGTPYRWGGNDLTGGIDCSGFVKALYGQAGMKLPRTAAQQALVGKPITRFEDLRKGDRLYFWEQKRGKIGHTGIYVGNGYFVHSSSGHRGVATDYLGSNPWRKLIVAARR